MPEPAPAPPQSTNVCPSISRFGGWRCSAPHGHREPLHRFGAFRWTERESAPPAPPPAVESVLRLAAFNICPAMPRTNVTIAEIADRIRIWRRARYFDVETAGAIESWLAVYEGREVVR